jgi:ABC-type lipoprotein release transport system permease subunit
LALAALGVLLLALAASGLPAMRAASVDPIRALRTE